MEKKPSTAGAKIVLNIQKNTGDIKLKNKVKGSTDVKVKK